MSSITPPRNDFPDCPTCPYLRTAAPALCYGCVISNAGSVAEHRCPICSQELAGPASQDKCRNLLCNQPDRSISRIRAIAMDRYPVSFAVRRAKDYEHRGWAVIFARLLIGWLEQNAVPTSYDMIIHNPDYVAPPSPWLGHTAEVLQRAIIEDTLRIWPIIDPQSRLLTLDDQPTKSQGLDWSGKRAVAHERTTLLRLRRPDAFRNKRILVFDDLNTTGAQLDALAGYLLRRGAIDVEGLVIGRVPWRPMR